MYTHIYIHMCLDVGAALLPAAGLAEALPALRAGLDPVQHAGALRPSLTITNITVHSTCIHNIHVYIYIYHNNKHNDDDDDNNHFLSIYIYIYI